MDNKFKKEFDELKSTVLADLNATTEEVAIWLDLTCKTSCKELTRLLRIIIFNFHSMNDLNLNILNRRIATKVDFLPYHYSSAMFKNLFSVMFNTDLLDEAMSSRRFLSFVKKTKENCKKNAKQEKTLLDLFEVFAELLDKIEDKFKK